MKAVLFILASFSFFAMNGQGVSSISRGNEYYRASQFDLAEVQYRKAVESDPANTTARFNLANALQQQKKFDEAIKILGILSTVILTDSFIHNLLHEYEIEHKC